MIAWLPLTYGRSHNFLSCEDTDPLIYIQKKKKTLASINQKKMVNHKRSRASIPAESKGSCSMDTQEKITVLGCTVLIWETGQVWGAIATCPVSLQQSVAMNFCELPWTVESVWLGFNSSPLLQWLNIDFS